MKGTRTAETFQTAAAPVRFHNCHSPRVKPELSHGLLPKHNALEVAAQQQFFGASQHRPSGTGERPNHRLESLTYWAS
jgi:hypothetical protein